MIAAVAPARLRAFNEAGVLDAADVHVARRLGAIGGEDDELVLLAAALAVRAPRVGDVYADLATIHATALPDAEEGEPPPSLDWPPPGEWRDRVARSPLVAIGEDGAAARPLRLVGDALYLDRYWRDEGLIAAALLGFAEGAAEAPLGAAAPRPSGGPPAAALDRLFDDPRQRLAAASALRDRLTVVAGGPGTGKTTTVARIVALLLEQAPSTLIALAAPTAKAAARLGEAIVEEAGRMDVEPAVADRLRSLEALTLHRLLGRRRDSHSRFHHDRSNRLPYDVVIVDETSMVSLTLMARLLEAIRPGARLILVGDPGQLAAIQAGAVLTDVVGAAEGASPISRGVVVLDRVFRFGGGVGALADAVRRGDADAAVEVLRGAPEGVTWLPSGDTSAIRDDAVAAARAVREAAREGAAARAVAALGGFRILCAHRRGDHGVSAWTARVEGWLADRLEGFRADVPWYVGRPLLVTENDYGLRLFNGDTGVVVAAEGGGLLAAFPRQAGVAEYHRSRLSAIETVYAMTIHKSQGSQFDTAAVVLPEPDSRLLTRELLYTAVTRAKARLILAGGEEAVRAAIERPVARASGLRARLSGDP